MVIFDRVIEGRVSRIEELSPLKGKTSHGDSKRMNTQSKNECT